MYQMNLSKENPFRETEKALRNNLPAQMGSGLPRQIKSLYSPLQLTEKAAARNVPAKKEQTEPVIQRLMTYNQFVGQTTPHFGARGKHNMAYYAQIDPLLQEYETPGTTDRRKLEILHTLQNTIDQWTADRPNSSRADVRNELLNNIQQDRLQQAEIWRQRNAGGGFSAANIEFVSRNVAGNVGSIYFNNGRRIRLTHGNGPEVSQNQVDVRYSLMEGSVIDAFNIYYPGKPVGLIEDFILATGFQILPNQNNSAVVIYSENGVIQYIRGNEILPATAMNPQYWGPPANDHFTVRQIDNAYKIFRNGKNLLQIQAFLAAFGAVPAVAGGGGTLFELRGNGAHSHRSRGGPEALGFDLTDESVNLLYHAADIHDNDILRTFMALDPDGLLNQIPIN